MHCDVRGWAVHAKLPSHIGTYKEIPFGTYKGIRIKQQRLQQLYSIACNAGHTMNICDMACTGVHTMYSSASA